MARIRLDKMVLKQGLASSNDEALELIESGNVLVNGSAQKSPNSFVESGSALEMVPKKPKYVSRGGIKLDQALEKFKIDPTGLRCLDIGSSTGGFTDCLIQKGANHVVSVDVGHGQIDNSFRNNEKVTILEKTNAKKLIPSLIGGTCQLGVMDVSFTSVIQLIKPVLNCLDPKELVILIKPQFEVEQKFVNSKGIVTNEQAQIDCINKISKSLPLGIVINELIESPIKGAKGNIEFLVHLTQRSNPDEAIDIARIESVVKNAKQELIK